MSSRRYYGPKLELKLNLSPASGSTSSSRSTSPRSSGENSCVSGGTDDDRMMHNGDVSQEVTSSPMVLVGCPRCLMFVMLSEVNPQCPLCKSTVLLDFVNGHVHVHKKGQLVVSEYYLLLWVGQWLVDSYVIFLSLVSLVSETSHHQSSPINV